MIDSCVTGGSGAAAAPAGTTASFFVPLRHNAGATSRWWRGDGGARRGRARVVGPLPGARVQLRAPPTTKLCCRRRQAGR